MTNNIEAYLDIETTGLSAEYNEITVVGIYVTGGKEDRFIQLVGHDITGDAILESMEGVKRFFTYNGHRFDLPFIRIRHGVNLETCFDHDDLMNHCWERKLFGGLKAVERCLGIERRIKEMNGLEAIRLWWQYVNNYDQEALRILLEYNREDVINLKLLRDKVCGNAYPL